MEKEPFVPAECEVVVIEKTDVITTSLEAKSSLEQEGWGGFDFDDLFNT